MSSMLEQAIVDAAALREAALKNAEQAIIEKYAPQIKEAVNSLLSEDVGAAGEPLDSVEAPFAASPMSDPNAEVEFTMTDEEQTWEFDLEELKQEVEDEMAVTGEEPAQETTEDLMGDLGLETDEAILQEITNLLDDVVSENEEETVLEEELVVDMGEAKSGWVETNTEMLKYQQEMQLAKEESTKYKEENEELEKKAKKLAEKLTSSNKTNKKLYEIVKKMETSLNETLLANAKLLYSNKTLSDASLNERQKNKIVEAIANAKTPDEARNLQETLKTTVGTTKNTGPKSLSESVERKSNLSGIISRHRKPEQKEYSFAQHMKKLAGIK